MRLLHLGCGHRVASDWTNVDFIATSPEVMPCDLRRGIPFGDNTFDVVYHSHLLEHFTRPQAPIFIGECYRVLRPGGWIRVVVPDLLYLAENYIEAVKEYHPSTPELVQRHEWSIIHLIDQMTRNSSGGEMLKFVQREDVSKELIRMRWGQEGVLAMRKSRRAAKRRPPSPTRTMLHHKLALRRLPSLAGRIRRRMSASFLCGDDQEALERGRFRGSGESHLWMYDAISLRALLLRCGFQDVEESAHNMSHWSGWSDHQLDSGTDEGPLRPDSLYMEGRKLVKS